MVQKYGRSSTISEAVNAQNATMTPRCWAQANPASRRIPPQAMISQAPNSQWIQKRGQEIAFEERRPGR